MTLALSEQYGLNDTATRFVRYLSAFGDIKAAALRSGVSEGYGYDLIRLPAVQAALQLETRRLLTVGAAMGLKALMDLVENSKSDPVRAKCAVALLDRAGFVAPRAMPAGSGAEKTLNEMSVDELKDLAAKLENELVSRAKTINAPPKQDTEAQAADLLG